MRKLASTLVAVAACGIGPGAGAEGLSGARPMVCAATTVFVCAPGAGCLTGPPDAVNLPTFWHVDPAAKRVRSRRGGGQERISAIDSVIERAGHIVLHGTDEGFAWSVSIDVDSGKMLFTGGKDAGYVVFGECTTP